MNPLTKQFYRFLSSCGGSWRNSIYIACQEHPSGYLLAADREGKPVIIAVEMFQQFAGELIDPAECRGRLTQDAFHDIYAQYLLWQFPDSSIDALAALSHSGK